MITAVCLLLLPLLQAQDLLSYTEEELGPRPLAVKGAALMVELRGLEGEELLSRWERAQPLLEALERQGGGVSIVLERESAEQLKTQLRAAAERGHEWVLPLEEPEELGASWESWRDHCKAQLKQGKRILGRRLRSAQLYTMPPRAGELGLEACGLDRLALDEGGRARRLKDISGVAGTLVLPHGESPALQSLDAEILQGASETISQSGLGGSAVVILTLDVEALTSESLPLLEAWVSRRALPAGLELVTLKDVPLRATASLALKRPEQSRVVSLEELNAASRAVLEAGEELPRRPGGLTLGELWTSLSQSLNAQPSPWMVLSVRAPDEEPVSQHAVPKQVDPQTLDAEIRRLAASLERQAPNFVELGEEILSAAEFLHLMAQLQLGEDPLVLQRVTSPDPYGEGLGWED